MIWLIIYRWIKQQLKYKPPTQSAWAVYRTLPGISISASPEKRPPYAGEAERASDQPTPSKLVLLVSTRDGCNYPNYSPRLSQFRHTYRHTYCINCHRQPNKPDTSYAQP